MQKLFALMDKTNVITSAIGIFAYYSGLHWLLYVCAGLSILHSVLNTQYGGQNNLVTEMIAVAVGAVLALIRHKAALPLCAVSLCYWDVILLLPSAVMLVAALFGARKK
jgi:DMSO/TMAO reductase YedYZ heme-binding membrane subunit